MEETKNNCCNLCLHKGICKYEKLYKQAVGIWAKDETDDSGKLIYQITVYCPNQLKYEDVEYELTMQRDFERREAERDDW